MITKEEYLKAKSIIEEYEKQEYEEGMRQAEEELNEEDDWDDDDNGECSVCGGTEWHHYRGCVYNDPLAYNEVGYG